MFDLVTVVCVTYQSRSVVESLAATVRPFPHVLIIDNGSSDGTAAAARDAMPHARVIQRDGNGGFGKANNEAMAQVRTPLALLLNPDCDIKTADLQLLIDVIGRYPSAGMVAPQSWRAHHTPQKCYRPAFYEPPLKTPYRLADGTCSAQWLNGCCLLLRTQAFRDIGGFDESFFLFYEDDDLCLRMRLAGFECLLEPSANAWHTGGASSTPSLRVSFSKPFHYARSRHLAIRKYQGSGAGWRYLGKLMLAAVPAALIYGLLLRRRHFVKWVAWGSSAVASAVTWALTPESAGQPPPATEALKPQS
ncbi:MAG: glycosyltransferase family 2 protein [Pseudomonadota bacterium]|jgi:GT2 family glycosyltransferase|nr:glycosyltransferase family 2 protein [Xanthomonadaceae bacterium]MDE3209484.1 glycosyltransferase family 2 protein [Pseudomonadota bacterium]